MSVAKGRIYVSKEQLAIMLGLPEGVEVLALRPKLREDGFEFLLVSAEETGVTIKNTPISQLPVLDLQIQVVEQPKPEVHRGMATITIDSFDNIEVNNIGAMVIKQDEKDIKAIFDELASKVSRK